LIKAVTIRLYHNPPPYEVLYLAGRAKVKGANAVCLVPHHYCYLERGSTAIKMPPAYFHTPRLVYDDVGQDPEHPVQNTTSGELVEYLALAIEAMGMRVILKPHLDSYNAAWRYWITFPSATMLTRFRTAYRAMLMRYVRIAKQLKEPLLVMGCELPRVLVDSFWFAMALWLRSRYGANYQGELTYAANWGDGDFNRLLYTWPELDYVGVDAYWPLLGNVAEPSPTYEQIRAGWDEEWYSWKPSPADDMLEAAQIAGKPLLLTEFGLSNYTLAHRNPGADPPSDAIRDDRLQADWHRAMRDRFDPEPSFGGYIVWDYGLPGMSVPPVSHSILDRPAEDIAWRP
jgi:hypothetical protein